VGITGSGRDGCWRDLGMSFYRVSCFLKALELNAVSAIQDEKAWVKEKETEKDY